MEEAKIVALNVTLRGQAYKFLIKLSVQVLAEEPCISILIVCNQANETDERNTEAKEVGPDIYSLVMALEEGFESDHPRLVVDAVTASDVLVVPMVVRCVLEATNVRLAGVGECAAVLRVLRALRENRKFRLVIIV